MIEQTPGISGTVPVRYADDSIRPDADWNSPLWGQPDTVAAEASRAQQELPSAPPVYVAEQTRRAPRALLAAVAVALLAVGLVGAVLVNGALRGTSTTAALLPPPSVSLPVLPSPAPSQPSLTPPNQGSGQPGLGSQGAQAGQGSSNLTQSQQAAVAAVSPGLVDVVSTIGYDGAQGAGTGVVLTSDGIVLTNHHVVAGSTSITVTDIGNGNSYTAKVLGYDRSHDVAVLKLTGASGLQTAPLGNSANVAIADAVVAVGNALGKGGTPTAVPGTVTDLNQSITAQDSANGTSEQLTGLIQIDAPIQPGDSGGALVAADGTVVGIVTAGSATASSQQTATQGFAIPMATAHQVAEQIVAGRASNTVHIGGTAFLGLQVTGGTGTSASGVVVAGTVSGSAASGVGIVAGDVVTTLDGRTVPTADVLKSVLDGHHPGDSLNVGWTDQMGAPHLATVTLTDGPTG